MLSPRGFVPLNGSGRDLPNQASHPRVAAPSVVVVIVFALGPVSTSAYNVRKSRLLYLQNKNAVGMG